MPADAAQIHLAETLPWIAHYPAGVDWYMPLPSEPIPALLEKAARDFPDRPAINFLGRLTSYAALAAQVDTVASGLQKLGVGRGTKVGLFLPNTPTFIVYYYAILKCAATVVNFNPLYTLEELTFQAKDSETELMVTHDLTILFSKIETLMERDIINRAIVVPFADLLPRVKATLFRVFKRRERTDVTSSRVATRIVSGAKLAATAQPFTPVAIDPHEDVAVLQYTGGTTGTPKGAMLTHANLSANTAQICAWAPDLEPGKESILGALPLFHVFAMTVVMNTAVAKAAKMILMPRFQLAEALKIIHRQRPTMMPAVPTILSAMLHAPDIKSYDLSSLRFCILGGAPLPIELKHKFEAASGCKVVEGYGLSEASPVLTCNVINGPAISGSIGPPLPGTYISLRDLEDPTREVPQGERGELCAKGPQIMKGYWKKLAETEKQFVGDYLRTGDVAIMDENGFFSIVDRIKDLIICSGYNVYPRRIEEAIYQHPAVEEVTVIGIPDDYRGEAPKAFIKLKAGTTATAADILKHLESKISKIEMPSEIEFRDTLPKTMIGKLSKKELSAEEQKRRA